MNNREIVHDEHVQRGERGQDVPCGCGLCLLAIEIVKGDHESVQFSSLIAPSTFMTRRPTVTTRERKTGPQIHRGGC